MNVTTLKLYTQIFQFFSGYKHILIYIKPCSFNDYIVWTHTLNNGMQIPKFGKNHRFILIMEKETLISINN
jgi:hypothetical protein